MTTLAENTFSIDDFMAGERRKDLLRFSTAGSVDDGKSTLIGRLLYDTQSVYEDQVRSIEGKGTTAPGQIDFALLTDGLRAEREQGITIDVAYRYFSTARRKFIIADTPGHEQYTRNMATGSSTADATIVLIDARKGVLPQSRRHAYIASLLGVRQMLVAVNKMDLVDYSEERFCSIQADFSALLDQIAADTGNPVQPYFLPVSALIGDNVVHRSAAMVWYTGPSLIDLLESLPAARHDHAAPLRFAVQRVLRPDASFRGFAGQIASGSVRPGDAITALPSGRIARVARISTFDGDLDLATAPLSVTLVLDREIDVSRGDLIVSAEAQATVTTDLEASLVWMDVHDLIPDRRYLLKHASHVVPATITSLRHRVLLDSDTPAQSLVHTPAATLSLNQIGVAALRLLRPIAVDSYRDHRLTGAFILIDPATNATVAAGMIRSAQPIPAALAAHLHGANSGPVSARERFLRWGHRGAILTLTGPSALADRVERALFQEGMVTLRLNAHGPATDSASDSLAAQAAASGLLVLLHAETDSDALSVSIGNHSITFSDEDAFTRRLHTLLADSGLLHQPRSPEYEI